MAGRSSPARLLALVAFGVGALGCSRGVHQAPASDAGLARDASRDVRANEGGPALDAASDASLALPVLHISVTGCATFDVADQICTGSAPLTLTFAPVGSAALDTFRWMFGDSPQASMETAPTHTYTLPRATPYAVTLNGGSLEDRNYTVAGVGCFVSVLPLAAGAACDVDGQCGDGLQCFCKAGAGCGPAFSRGICSTSCSTGFCGTGAVCADIALGAPAADGGAAAPVCLADCSSNGKCAAGFVCQQIPSGGTSAAWVSACLPLGAANDFGASCRDSNGALDDSACTTGQCADVGALGMCTTVCSGAQDCPPGAACATSSGAATGLCFPACSPAFPCTRDPALQCTPAAGGDAGLTISGTTPGTTYCAPR